MSTRSQTLLADVEAFLRNNPGIAESTFGAKAVNDGKFIARLRAGRRVWPETEDRVRAFMAANRFPQAAA